MTQDEFHKSILSGIPDSLPAPKAFDASLNHAPKRKIFFLLPKEYWP